MSSDFNKSAQPKPGQWPEGALQALAVFFADQLPEAYTTYDSKPGGGATAVKVPITAQNKTDFIAAFIQEVKAGPRSTNRYGHEYIEVETSIGDLDKPYPAICSAFDKAGISEAFHELEFQRAYLYADGQVFAKGAPLDYDGKPQTPYISSRDVDFTGCPWMRSDTRYFVVPLEAGQTVTIRSPRKDAPYEEKTAREGEALVIPFYSDREAAAGMTKNLALDLRRRDNVKFASICKAADYAHGAEKDGTRFEHLDAEGHCRRLSRPFQLFTATQIFATGSDSDYHVMQPGDCITRKPEGDKGWAHHEVVLKSWMDSNRRNFLPCAPDGTLTDLTTLDKPVTALKPLKFTGGKPPS